MTKEEKQKYNKEYREANKDEIKQYKKEYYQANKDKIKEYYEANKDKIKDIQKEYREANKDKINDKMKDYYEANKDKIKDKKKEYREANKDEIKQYKKEYYQANKDKIKDKMKIWRKQNATQRKEYYLSIVDKRLKYRLKRQENPIYRLQQRLRSTLHYVMLNSGYADDSLSAIRLGCSYDIFKLHIEEQFPRGMNWDNKHLWQFDHIKPFSSVTTEDETLKLAHYTNIQPLWTEDNKEKHKNPDWVKCPIKYAK